MSHPVAAYEAYIEIYGVKKQTMFGTHGSSSFPSTDRPGGLVVTLEGYDVLEVESLRSNPTVVRFFIVNLCRKKKEKMESTAEGESAWRE